LVFTLRFVGYDSHTMRDVRIVRRKHQIDTLCLEKEIILCHYIKLSHLGHHFTVIWWSLFPPPYFKRHLSSQIHQTCGHVVLHSSVRSSRVSSNFSLSHMCLNCNTGKVWFGVINLSILTIKLAIKIIKNSVIYSECVQVNERSISE
jgi:hypothetical protein